MWCLDIHPTGDIVRRRSTASTTHPLDKLQVFLLVAPVLLFSMVAHEYAHGYAALRQGDSTAYQLGRLTWNPLKHVDPMMTVVMPIVTYAMAGFFFGGAKPVPVNPRNYRRYRRGDIIVSLAGVFVNLCLAVVCTLLIIVFGIIGSSAGPLRQSAALLQAMMYVGVLFNTLLAFFNLLPIPPLDGSHVFKYLLPPSWAIRYQQIGFFGLIIVILVIVQFPIYIAPVFYSVQLARDLAGDLFLPEAIGWLQRARLWWA